MRARAAVARLAAALLAAALPHAAGAQGIAVASPYALPDSAVLSVAGAAGETYRVLVAWPEGKPPAAGWPVLYVLDGENDFAITALTARRLARAGGRSGIDAGIVVGIEAGPLPRRVRDYTPPTPGWTIPAGQPAAGLATGGAEPFLDLLAGKVQPLVRARWPVDRSRETLLGHSFGALLALHAALTRPDVVDAVVAVSPSLWFGDGLIGREAARGAGRIRFLVAEGVPADASAPAPTPAASLVDLLARQAPPGTARFLSLPGQSHGTTMLAATAPAIAFAFAGTGR